MYVVDLTGTNDAAISPSPQMVPLESFISNLNFFLSSLTSASSPYSVASTPISIILIALQPIVPTMKPSFNAPGHVKQLDPANQRRYRDAILQVGAEWKEREEKRGERVKSGAEEQDWKIEVLDFWEVMVRDAGGEEDALLAKYFE